MTDRTVLYAIGDVHGELVRLRELHEAVFDFHERTYPELKLKLIHLGDYIDRGPDSAGVIQLLMDMEADPAIDIVNLRGNHEQMMLDAYSDSARDYRLHWLTNGGDATLESYIRRGQENPYPAHLDWARNLPTLHLEEERKMAFVHAGVDPKTFPNCSDNVLMWTRSNRFFQPGSWDIGNLKGWKVVHGHTPTRDFRPQSAGDPPRRFNLDTGAVYGGVLTAGVFAPDNEPAQFLTV